MQVILAKLFGKPVIILLGLVILVMMTTQLILSNQLATSSNKLSQILAGIENYEQKNRNLAVQIYEKGSISKLKELAANYGFGEPKKFFFVRQNFLIAQDLR